MDRKRKLIYFKNYYWDFYNAQKEKVKDKIDYVLFLITVADRIPKKFFDQISGYDGLFEIRIEFESNIFRIFCCFDEGDLVILFNGFQKKTQKTPKKEIERAARIKEEYFETKRKEEKNEKYSNI
jgi:phage-related protein